MPNRLTSATTAGVDTPPTSGTVFVAMRNFFFDTPDLVSIFDRLDLREPVRILERGYTESGEHDLAPSTYDEAIDAYRSALELIGDLAANVIAPRSPGIDEEGASLVDGEVRYPTGATESYRRIAESGMAGALLPRRFGGLNFPATVYVMMIEMVSRADASLMTMFGYQDVGEAIAHFGPEETAARLLPRYAVGETIGAMVLTEPGGGSDLAGVRTVARQDETGQWRLSGTKQFISNGNGGLLLVLARSEPGVNGMFGLSLFASDGSGVTVSRLEEKMGLHGSPTCELVFDDAPAWLVGKRRMGMVQTMYTLNHARFSVAAQALGIADAAYRMAAAYSHERKAFGRPIRQFPGVASMLADMATTIEACRALIYDGCQRLDLRNKLEVEIDRVKQSGSDTSDLKRRFKQAAAEVDLLSPAVKAIVSEAAQRICLDAQQIFGGMGYIRETGIERLVRDVRITTIYEGTTQVQMSAALAGVLADTMGHAMAANGAIESGLEELSDRQKELGVAVTELRELVAGMDPMIREAAARDTVEAYLGLWAAHLLFEQARVDERKRAVCGRWVALTLADVRAAVERLRCGVHALDDFDSIVR